MRIHVLGSAAGGGFPQWNCGCANCADARLGDPRTTPRTQDSLAISDGERWFLCNASPDVRQQLESFAPLHPRGPRDTPIDAVVLTSGDLDHCLGLYSLREAQPLVIYATEPVWRGLVEDNATARTLMRFAGQLSVCILPLDEEVALVGAEGRESALRITAIAVPGKLPSHLVGLRAPDVADNIALLVRDERDGRRVLYAPGVASIETLAPWLDGPDRIDCLLFDGTFWASDELSRPGLLPLRAEEMAHLPVGGPRGSLARLARCRVGRRVYTHVNNTNPILREGSAERRAVEEAGWEVAVDGMEVMA